MEEEQQISILDMVYLIISKWPALLLSTVLAALLAFAFTMAFITPKYESVGKLYVSSEGTHSSQNDTVAYNTVLTNLKLVNTYMEILRSDSFLTTVSEDIGGKYSSSQIKSMLTMSSVNDTELLEVKILCADPYDAYKITNSIIKNSSDEIERVVKGGSVSVIDNASQSNTPSTPNVAKNTGLGGIIGLIIGAIVIFLMEMLDTRVKPGEDLQNKYSIPVLGEIPWIIKE